ncbi:MAG: DUF1987 domain-containing protein [Bacteroidales bacterium]|jgi:hypothetical protein|nr:DUF1987 domain-containing protein [Bacteroidales bacterium]
MNELRIPPTKTSPEIILDPGGIVKITGRSIHENIADFFRPVEEWIHEYVRIPAEVTVIDINLEYINSASAKVLVHIFQKIAYLQLKSRKYIINWYYEEGDDDILERGEYFSSILGMPFNFIKIS